MSTTLRASVSSHASCSHRISVQHANGVAQREELRHRVEDLKRSDGRASGRSLERPRTAARSAALPDRFGKSGSFKPKDLRFQVEVREMTLHGTTQTRQVRDCWTAEFHGQGWLTGGQWGGSPMAMPWSVWEKGARSWNSPPSVGMLDVGLERPTPAFSTLCMSPPCASPQKSRFSRKIHVQTRQAFWISLPPPT